MIISPDKSIGNKLSWFKSDISSINSLDRFPYFSLIKLLNFILTNGYFIFIVGVKFYASNYKLAIPNEYNTVQEILTFNPQRAILIGTTISLIFSLLIIGSLIKTYFSTKLSYLGMPEIIRKDKDLSLIYAAIKAPDIVPKGFDIILSTAFGAFGILFFIFLLLVNQENNTLLDWSLFLFTYTTIFYSLMRSVFIAFNPYSLLNSTILFAIILLPPYLANHKLIPGYYESLLIFWIPIITLYLLPALAKSRRPDKNQVPID